MKTWHWIAIGAVVLVGAWYLFARQGSTVGVADMGVKVAGGVNAGAPPLPNLSLANPDTKITFNSPTQATQFRTGLGGLGAVAPTKRTQTLQSSIPTPFLNLLGK